MRADSVQLKTKCVQRRQTLAFRQEGLVRIVLPIAERANLPAWFLGEEGLLGASRLRS
jgi:hypothetical protein